MTKEKKKSKYFIVFIIGIMKKTQQIFLHKNEKDTLTL